MANNKNQHFVPKVYLRPFGNEDKRSINLYAFGPDCCISDASIKGQCSRNYFYGHDAIFDNFNKYFEGQYGSTISRLEAGHIANSDVSNLYRFFVLQYLRTPHMLQQRTHMIDAFKNMVIGGKTMQEHRDDVRKPIDPQREMQHQIYIAAKENDALHDLAPVILLNKTKVPFITSDNPACLTNRLYTQRYRDGTSGLIQSGVAIALPLTPQVMFFGYDSDVYHSLGSEVITDVRSENDVYRLNELQAQIATSTLFFANWRHHEYVTDLARRTVGRRKDNWSYVWTGIRDGGISGYERYRKVTDADAQSNETRITSVSPFMASPSTWPSFLRFKLRPVGYTTGSAVGYVRQAHAEKRADKRLSELLYLQIFLRPINRSIAKKCG
jgi:Protein of unknown function (DUF4238)